MAKALTDAEREEVTRLHGWILELLELVNVPPLVKDLAAKSCRDAAEREDLRALRAGARDFASVANGMTPDRWNEVDQILRSKFGVGLRNGAANAATSLAKVLERGEIRSDEEYQLVKQRLDQIQGNASAQEESDALAQLIERDLVQNIRK